MKQVLHSSGLFLTELIFDLLIFVVCAIICVGLLLQSYHLSEKSQRLTDAVYLAQSTAEMLRDQNTPAAESEGYTIEWQQSTQDGLCYAHIIVCCDSEEIFALDTAWVQEVQP